ncbi:MAG TPA: hypothetical protein VIY48_08485, partial [Candidatus Paceibacterota bacterium]
MANFDRLLQNFVSSKTGNTGSTGAVGNMNYKYFEYLSKSTSGYENTIKQPVFVRVTTGYQGYPKTLENFVKQSSGVTGEVTNALNLPKEMLPFKRSILGNSYALSTK